MYTVTPNPFIYNGLIVIIIILLHSVLWVTYDRSRISIMDIVQYHTPTVFSLLILTLFLASSIFFYFHHS